MKRQPRILAGTAIGLFMASAPLGAMPLPDALSPTGSTPPLMRVQAECQEGESAEACAARQGDGQQQEQPRRKGKHQQAEEHEQPAPEPQAEQPRRNKRQPVEEAAPQAQPAPEPQPEQPRRNKRQPVEEAAPQQPVAEPQAEQPRRNKRQPAEDAAPQEQPAPEPQAEQPRRNKRQPVEEAAPQQPVAEPQAEQPRRNKRQPVEEAAPEAQPAPEPQAEQPRRKNKDKDKAPSQEASPEAQPVPTPETAPQPQAEKPAQPTPEQVPTPAPSPETAAPSGEAPSGEAPAADAPVQGEQPAKPGKPGRPGKKPNEQPSAGEQPPEKPAEQPETGEQPAQRPATGEQPVAGEQPAKPGKPGRPGKTPAEQPAAGEQKPAEKPAEGEQPAQQPAAGEQPAQQPAEPGKKPVLQGEAPVNPNEAPLLDSEKDEAPVEAGGKPGRGEKPGHPGKGGQGDTQGGERRPRPAPVDQGPPPTDDRAATEAAQPVDVQPVTAERGKRRDRAPNEDIRRRPRPEGTEVLREFGDRLIIQLNNQIIVESNDRPRMTRNAQEVYYEDLPRGRTREVIVRDNGNQIITIRNRHGDIIRRSRITPDGREYVLSYVDDRHYDDLDQWRDPGLDLPPMQLHIPRNEYILDAQYVEDPDVYYDFLEQPPVERVQRLYSVDEVKRSARVRDIARRVDLDTLNFEFGSASISESEIAKLEGVANAMEKLLTKNPAETFLIEGHTDAVGSDLANLALSDRRAESVADALTNVFGIAPENLTTQGYGERYLKVKSQKQERENRRVAIRRITPLVAPVASAR